MLECSFGRRVVSVDVASWIEGLLCDSLLKAPCEFALGVVWRDVPGPTRRSTEKRYESRFVGFPQLSAGPFNALLAKPRY